MPVRADSLGNFSMNIYRLVAKMRTSRRTNRGSSSNIVKTLDAPLFRHLIKLPMKRNNFDFRSCSLLVSIVDRKYVVVRFKVEMA